MRTAAAGLVCLFVLIGCSARGAETNDPSAIVCGWIASPDGFNPLTSISSQSTMIEEEIFTPLVDIGADLLPAWKTSFAGAIQTSNAGKRYILKLRRHAVWSDGVPITANDVVFSLNAYNNPEVIEAQSARLKLMTSVRALDRYTVAVTLSEPSPPFLTNALGTVLVLPQHVLDRYPRDLAKEAQFINTNSDFAQHPIISGPFRVRSFVPDAYTILEPNPRYWGAKAHLSQIAFRVYPQQDSLYAAVDAGEIDVTDIPPNLWRVHERLKGRHRFIHWPWNVVFTLLPNFANPEVSFLKDVTVRRAMLYAIDRSSIVGGIMNGQADVLSGPVPAFSPYYNPKIPQYPYDPEKARRMLEADGWKLRGSTRYKDGKPLRFLLKNGGSTDAVASNVVELIQANLKSVGIACELQNEEINTFFADLHATKFQVALRGRILAPYPDDYENYDSHQTRARGGYNLGSYSNPTVDALIEKSRTAPSARVARQALDAYQEAAARDLPAIFLYSNKLGAVIPENLRGYVLTPNAPAALPMGLETWVKT
ncbi:MAG: peptide ABC transporter substrate-binding protein [Candidatus Eremiobacteraeota bacterium]|nr:peptide ABC transporter substrate-binding protein [Candidatus Eremiobacteraeota bacterium]